LKVIFSHQVLTMDWRWRNC